MNNVARANEARRMLKVFTSVAGVKAYDITLTNLEGKKFLFNQGVNTKKLIPLFEKQLQIEDEMEQNVIIRPTTTTSTHLIQCDGLSKAVLYSLEPYAFIGLKMAKGSYQAWFAVTGEVDENYHVELRRSLRAFELPGAAPPTRLAGSRNFQKKYAPEFPIIEVVFANKSTTTTKEQLDAFFASSAGDEASSRKMILNVDTNIVFPPADEYEGIWPVYPPDPDRADFAWCMAAVSTGKAPEVIAAKLYSISKNAQRKGKLYALTVARRSVAFQRISA